MTVCHELTPYQASSGVGEQGVRQFLQVSACLQQRVRVDAAHGLPLKAVSGGGSASSGAPAAASGASGADPAPVDDMDEELRLAIELSRQASEVSPWWFRAPICEAVESRRGRTTWTQTSNDLVLLVCFTPIDSILMAFRA